MVYIGLVSTINGFEQTINLRIKVNLFCEQRYRYVEEITFMQNLFLRYYDILKSAKKTTFTIVFRCIKILYD